MSPLLYDGSSETEKRFAWVGWCLRFDASFHYTSMCRSFNICCNPHRFCVEFRYVGAVAVCFTNFTFFHRHLLSIPVLIRFCM